MSLSQIHAAIVAELNAGRPTPVPVLLGDEFLEEHSQPPRIVCVPTSDTFSPAEKGGVFPRAIRTRNIGTFWRVWAKTHDEAEQMLNDLVVAIHVVTGGCYQLGEADWLVKGALTHLGAACDIDVQFQAPVTRSLPVVAVKTASASVGLSESESVAVTATGTPGL